MGAYDAHVRSILGEMIAVNGQNHRDRDAYARNLRALIVHSSDQVSAAIVEELHRLGLRAEAASTPNEAENRLYHVRYQVLLLDDELPNGGSLSVFDALDHLEDRRPEVVMLSVPREALADARTLAEQDVEYVAHPQTQDEINRLAMRIRTRMVNVGLVEDFALDKEAASDLLLSRTVKNDYGTLRKHSERRIVLPVVAVFVILVALLLVLRILHQAGVMSWQYVEPVDHTATAMTSAGTFDKGGPILVKYVEYDT